MRTRLLLILSVGSIGMTACSLRAGDPGRVAASVPGEFSDHLQRVDGGRVDWTNGYILADGIGHPNGRETSEEQRRSMAMRAAEIVAARNALAISQGVRIDASRRVGDIADGQVHIQGVIRGHRIMQSSWDPSENPPTARVVLHVPLWGVRGVASLFVRSQYAAAQQAAGGRRLVLSTVAVDVSDFEVVIDARGRKMEPCLFPVIVDAEGRTLYDVVTLSADAASRGPIVRYVETKMSFEQLRSEAGSRFRPVWFDVLAKDSPGDAESGRVPTTSTTREAAPDAQPGRRRAKQSIVVKAVDGSGAQRRQLVITREDAERLRNSPEASGAIRKAQVVVVVDASAAGSEGRAPFEADTAVAVVSREP